MAETVTQPANDIAAQEKAGRALAREKAPDLFFASHFLPKPQRREVFTLWAVLRQLQDILDPCATPSSGACGSEGGGREDASGGGAGSGSGSGEGGCSSCGGESIEQRRAVCVSVLDFLFAGEKTGKPELDGFHAIVQSHGIPRDLFDSFVRGLTTLATLKRYPTWNKLRGVCSDTAGAAGMILFRAVEEGALSRERLGENGPTQVIAWADAMQMIHVLGSVGEDWKKGRLLLPLDDLVKFDLSDKDIAAFVEAGTAAGDARWSELMKFEAARVRNLFQGGANCLRGLLPGAQCAAAVFGQLQLAKLDVLESEGFEVFRAREEKASLWRRLKSVPGAVAMAGRAERGRR